ncbi:MAG TPA: VOC family protein [Burkholderiales bacterium]|nr:VOC family protein [Burkholderiales bacterium]
MKKAGNESAASPRPGVVLFVSDVARVARFYEAVARMDISHADDEHVVLQGGGFELVVHRVHGGHEAAGAATGDVHVREDSACKLCLPVNSIAAARAAAASHGGFVKDGRHEWAGRGFRACDGHDPEGNVIQVREGTG